jgi:uncharacterized protein YndB with AHSA1/START domain
MENQKEISVGTSVKAPLEKVWEVWTTPEHIQKWNFASDEWHCPRATNDLRTGGSFSSRMEAKDSSIGFDFAGRYDRVVKNQFIGYSMEDGRKVSITFSEKGKETKVVECFEPEKTNPEEMQKNGWQAILDNFKKYVEELREQEDLKSISSL